MPLTERKSSLTDKNEVSIECDICNLSMYHNNTEYLLNIRASEYGIYICSICARKMLLSDLKALSTDD